jgi:hypothetical protein
VDENDLRRWQSGLFYPDLTPKTSFAPVRDAILLVRRGILAKCPGLAVDVEPIRVEFPQGARVPAKNRRWLVVAGCVRDCVYVARLQKLPRGSTTLARSGVLVGGKVKTLTLPLRKVARGSYRLTLRLTARMNAGAPVEFASEPIEVG